MKAITSVQNPAVKEARALADARGRAAQNAFLLDGEHMVQEAFGICPGLVRAVFVREDCADAYAALLKSAACECFAVPARVMEAVTQVKTPQGIAAVCGMPPPAATPAMGDKLVLAENVQDPGNIGTILRTLDAAGFHGLILTPGCADPFGPKALRASMGSALRVPIFRAESAPSAVEALNGLGWATLASALDGEDFYRRDPLPRRVCLLVGNEGAGLRPETVRACTHRFRLPMRGGAESLNAAVAAGVFMYEIINRAE